MSAPTVDLADLGVLSVRTAPDVPFRGARPLDVDACRALVASERWAEKVAESDESGCTSWTGGTTDSGYGSIWLGGCMVTAHRVAYVVATGEDIPVGMVLDHACRNRRCVNPDHLRIVTNRQNTLAGTSFSALNARRTHCPAGHSLTEDNLRRGGLARGWRQCLTCHRQCAAARRDAHMALGITQRAYRALYGQSRATAEAVVAAVENDDHAALAALRKEARP